MPVCPLRHSLLTTKRPGTRSCLQSFSSSAAGAWWQYLLLPSYTHLTAQIAPPARATVPPSLRESSSRVEQLMMVNKDISLRQWFCATGADRL
jgi:hypothetical protein